LTGEGGWKDSQKNGKFRLIAKNLNGILTNESSDFRAHWRRGVGGLTFFRICHLYSAPFAIGLPPRNSFAGGIATGLI
jgi:hypothetical protein